MSFTYTEKPSGSRFVDVVWHTHDTSDGTYLASADSCWDMIFITSRGKTTVLLSGPSTKTTPVHYKAGNVNFGIRFKPSSFLTHVPVITMIDVTKPLPMPTPDTFMLGAITFPLPSYETVDAFLHELEKLGLLSDSPIVREALYGKGYAMSKRTLQRHFAKATGLTPYQVKQIARAREAVGMLQRGVSITQVVHELGYADQAHMTRQLKQLTGYTPAQNSKRDEPV
jgi:AraC-like DNA-binding protein